MTHRSCLVNLIRQVLVRYVHSENIAYLSSTLLTGEKERVGKGRGGIRCVCGGGGGGGGKLGREGGGGILVGQGVCVWGGGGGGGCRAVG